MKNYEKDDIATHEGRNLAAIMFTDIVGYTALAQMNEAQALDVLKRHNQFLRPLFKRFGGREVKTIGDSFLVEFASALDATSCAVEIQKSLHDYNLSTRDDWKIKIRIGIHLGDVVHENEDIFGDAVNIASRIQPLADPEGICVSEQVFDQVHNKQDYRLEQLDQTHLKNVEFETNVFALRMPWDKPSENGETFPPSSFKKLDKLDKFRIAILPFSNMSPDANDEYFADGLTEELISTMSKLSELSVIARTSVMSYKKKDKIVSEIARELNVGTILEGSVRKFGNRARITVQLIDANMDKHLWAENYDRSLEDIFAVQSDVAEKIATALQVKLMGEDKTKIGKRSTSSVEAHLEYLKGRYNTQRWDKNSLENALNHFEKAVELDQKYALAYCGMASVYSTMGFQGMLVPKEAYQKAKNYAMMALELDETLPEAHTALALALLNEYDFEGRERELKRAIELDSNLAEPHFLLAYDFSFKGRNTESIRELERAIELDPVSIDTLVSAGTLYLYANQLDKSIEYLKSALELDPVNYFCLQNLGVAHIRKGMIDEGLSQVKKAVEAGGAVAGYSDLAYAYVKANKFDEARNLLSSLEMERERGFVVSTAMAGVYASLGEKEKALDCLERSYDERSGYLPAVASDFVFDSLRDEPRFRALIRKMGLQE